MYSVGKTYNGRDSKGKFYIFEVTEVRDSGYIAMNVLYTENDRMLRLGADGAYTFTNFMKYADFKESPSVDFTNALVDLTLALRSKDLFDHFTKKGIVS